MAMGEPGFITHTNALLNNIIVYSGNCLHTAQALANDLNRHQTIFQTFLNFF